MAKEFNIKEWQGKHLNELPSLHAAPRGFIKDGNFDSRFKDAMGGAGFSDEEQDDIMSRDVGSPFPGEPVETTKAREIINNQIKPAVRNMDPTGDEIQEFNKEMIEYFLETGNAAAAAAKIWFGKKGL